MKSPRLELIDVTPQNLQQTGFFCYMSKRKTEAFQRKLDWVEARLREGMRIKIIGQGGRGFIEYVPGEYGWRAVRAKGYMLIHCIWIVGKRHHGQGHGSFLLKHCIDDARKAGMLGVAMVVSDGVWLAGKGLLEKNGFEQVDAAPPAFSLYVKRFRDGAKPPSFPRNWTKRAAQHPRGLTIFRSDQCPYVVDAVGHMQAAAAKRGIDTSIVELKRCQEVRRLSPTAYGIFGAVYEGKLLSYHYVLDKDFDKQLALVRGTP